MLKSCFNFEAEGYRAIDMSVMLQVLDHWRHEYTATSEEEGRSLPNKIAEDTIAIGLFRAATAIPLAFFQRTYSLCSELV